MATLEPSNLRKSTTSIGALNIISESRNIKGTLLRLIGSSLLWLSGTYLMCEWIHQISWWFRRELKSNRLPQAQAQQIILTKIYW